MADTTAVFDKLVFSFFADIADIAPVVLRVALQRQFYNIAAGQEVPITLYVIDTMTTPSRQFLHNPAVGPAIAIYSPTNVELLAATAMPQVETGIFTYIYHTEPSHASGAYSAVFTASNGDSEMVSPKHHVFNII